MTVLAGLRHPRKRDDQHRHRHHQSGGGRFRHRLRRVHGQSDKLASVYAERIWRRDERRRDCFFRLHRFRCRFHDGGGDANPQRDMPIGIIASLIICTLLYVLMSGVLTGMKKYTVYLGDSAAVATAFAGKPWAQALISAGALAGTDLGAAGFSTGPAAHFHGDGAGRIAPAIFRQDPSALSARRTSPPSGPASSWAALPCSPISVRWPI